MPFQKIKMVALTGIMICLTVLSYAQVVTIQGTISSADDGETLIGATILAKGTSIGTATDLDGKYTLNVPESATTLVISYVGFTQTEVEINGRTTVDVALSSNSQVMDEVIVVGYGTQLRSEITGSVSTISEEDITATPALRVEQALQGRTAGVQISQNSGSPGSALNVRIRGVGTINNADPLYIVDGFAVGGLDFLNPGDIESINVLKDAAAAAIYGARGANGVVLITTKQGKLNQRPEITYDMYYGQQKPWKHMNLLNAEEYAIIINEAHRADGAVAPFDLSEMAELGEGTNWQEEIFEDAPIMNHSLTIRGGSPTSTYSITGSHFTQQGIVGGEKSAFERQTFRVNMGNQVFDRFNVGTSIAYTHLSRNGLPENNEFSTPLIKALNIDPITPVYKPDGTFAYSEYADTDITNPVNFVQLSNDNYRTNRLNGNFFAELEIIDGLKLRSQFAGDVALGEQHIFFPAFNLSIDTALNDAPAGEIRDKNVAVVQDNKFASWQWDNTITYTREFDQHNLTLLAGTSALDWKNEYHGGSKANLPSNDPEDAFLDNFTEVGSERAWNGASEFSFLSYFGRVNYVYDNKYLFAATMRADGSSRFGENNRFGYFPSASVGWVVSQEDFFADIPVISFLKVRASWGQNGNAEIGNYAFTSTIFQGQNYTLGPDEVIFNGAGQLSTSNPDLRWETNTQTDIGIDLELLEGKINITTDVYLKKTTDMLAVIPIPAIVGLEPAVTNVGDVTNKGFEFEAEYRKRSGAFTFDVSGNIAFIRSEVTSLGEGGDPINSGNVQSANSTVALTDVGNPIAAFYGYVTDGIFQNQAEVDAHATQNGAVPGDIRFADLNGDGVVDNLDQTFIGNPTPDFSYGLTASAAYKGFDMSIFLQGTQGNDIYNATVRYDFVFANRPNSVLDRWTGEGTSNDEPRVSLSDQNQNARVSDRFVEDGSYMRIKNLQIGYTLPRSITEKMKFRQIRFYVAAQNLFTFTEYSGLDPEIGTRGSLEIGIDRGFYPQARTYMAGLNIKI